MSASQLSVQPELPMDLATENDLRLPSTPRIAEMQLEMKVGLIPPLFISSASVRVITALTETVPLNMMHPLAGGKTLADYICYSETDIDDIAARTDDAEYIEELAEEINSVDVEDMDSYSQEEVMFITISEEIVDILEDLDKLKSNKERRYYLYCVFDFFHCDAADSITLFEKTLRNAVTIEACFVLSDTQIEEWKSSLQTESHASELAVSNYYLRHKPLLQLYAVGFLYQRPHWFMGIPKPHRYDHVEFFCCVHKGGIFRRLHDRFKFGERESLIKLLWTP
ncbi:hypothetical protein CYMTET_31836 [Cymbomonas tetramitiformis]|uniref:Uncharacterized protein n=1 Tax=Cymbomonas tetramitiformis TaxID=36881 RepID=A0AAE0FH25_9CHLO|nr:hypothetical protein CYMTET_31836 [Cymbomonas tetramitiformis]